MMSETGFVRRWMDLSPQIRARPEQRESTLHGEPYGTSVALRLA